MRFCATRRGRGPTKPCATRPASVFGFFSRPDRFFGFAAYFTENKNKRAAVLKKVATTRAKLAALWKKLGWGHPKVLAGSSKVLGHPKALAASSSSNGPREAAWAPVSITITR